MRVGSHYLWILGVALSSVLSGQWSYAHQGHDHHALQEKRPEIQPDHPQVKFKQINEPYIKRVKPIFLEKCMDCHGGQTRYPWYYRIPGIKQAIDSDIEEAKSHLDFSTDFPFKSHASIQEDLQAIQNSVLSGSMPPFSYRLMHPNSKLSDSEKKVVSDWVDESVKLLGN